jgi:CelD/BcsL family acetyltransferase involved in cellulose biosynthesis
MNSSQPQNNRLSISLLADEEFCRYRERWNKLLDASASESFFLRWEWIYTYWESLDKKNAVLQVWLCHDGDKLVGIAPFYVYSTMFMKIPVRKMAFLGDRVASDYMDIFAIPGYEEACCREVLGRVNNQSPVPYDILDLEGVCADSNLFRFLASGSDADGDIKLLPVFDCPRTCLNVSFDEYLQRLSASTRYSLGRKRRKLEKEFGKVSVEHFDLKNNPEKLDTLFDLHEQRWSVLKDKSSTFSSEYRKLFNRKLLQRFDEGSGYFSCMSIEGKPVSMMYVFVYKENAYFYQNGWNPVYAAYGVGILNIQYAIRHAIELGCKSFDFLRGEEAYKYHLCEDSRQAYTVRCFGSGMRGNLAKILFVAKSILKNLIARFQTSCNPAPRSDWKHFYCLQGRQS